MLFSKYFVNQSKPIFYISNNSEINYMSFTVLNQNHLQTFFLVLAIASLYLL